MKVSVAVGSREVNGIIPGELADASYLFIVDVDNFQIIRILPAEPENRDVFFAEQTVKEDCEAIICGEIEEAAFEILARAGVSRYLGTGETAGRSIKLMNDYRLPQIRDCKGGAGCPGAHGGGECHKHEE